MSEVINHIICGDCVEVLKAMPSASVDFVLTDPPYLVNYRSRDGRTIAGDNEPDALARAFTQLYRVLKADRFCVSFYAWNRVDTFMRLWKEAGFVPVAHFVWPKRYASSRRFARSQHEQAYLLAKGNPHIPHLVLPDVLEWRYTGNGLHPTQKPLVALRPLIKAFSAVGDIVLDPFAGSGTTALAAFLLDRRYIGIEVREDYATIAQQRLRKKGGEPPPMTDTTKTPNAPKYAKSPYPKFWLKCPKCQAFVSAAPQSVFRYIAKLLKVELDALDARYAKAANAAKEVQESTEE